MAVFAFPLFIFSVTYYGFIFEVIPLKNEVFQNNNLHTQITGEKTGLEIGEYIN